MADLFNDGRTFNASEHQTDPYFVEPGDYLMMIVGAEWKESKSSPGVEYLECKFQILSGTQSGKTLREILNLRHAKDDVRAIAERRLAEICKAVDRLNPRKTEDLLNLPFGARVYSKDSK